MSENLINTFKLNFDGTFEEIDYQNIKDVFTIVNILAIYIKRKKIMYIWIGKSATQALRNHISRIRVLMREEFPQFRIIRNITVEMRAETFDFFKNLDINKEELYAQINHQEKTILPIVEKIDNLKGKADKFIKSKEYGKAITNLKEIIELAHKIEDNATVIEQKKIISELTQKQDKKKIVSEIEEAALQAEREYNDKLGKSDIVGAYRVVESFEKSFETTYDLSLISIAKNLISKAQKRWNTEKAKKETDLFKLEKNFKNSIKKMEFDKASEIYETGKGFLSPLIDEKIQKKWEGFENILQDLNIKLELIEKFEDLSNDNVQLKKEHQYKQLRSKIKKLIDKFQKVDLPEYRSKLDILLKEVDYAEEFYKKTLGTIEELEKKTKDDKNSKKLDDVVKDCLSLIGFAKQIDLFEIIDRYQVILEETEKEIEERKILEEEQHKLKNNLSKLENNLESALKSMNLTKAREILDKGKVILSNIFDFETKQHWDDLEKAYKLTETKKDLMSETDKFLVESNALKEEFQFEILKPKVEKLLTQTQEMNIPEYLEKLELLRSEIDSKEEFFNKTLTEIIELGEIIKKNQEEHLLDEILKHCDKLIGLSKSIKRVEFIEKYSEIKSTTIKKIEEKKAFKERQQKLEDELTELEKDLKPSLIKMDLENVSKILEKSNAFLSELVDQTIKKKWDDHEFRFVGAKQLLNDVEKFSENGIETLIKGSCSDSLGYFKQIISQLQEYKVGE